MQPYDRFYMTYIHACARLSTLPPPFSASVAQGAIQQWSWSCRTFPRAPRGATGPPSMRRTPHPRRKRADSGAEPRCVSANRFVGRRFPIPKQGGRIYMQNSVARHITRYATPATGGGACGAQRVARRCEAPSAGQKAAVSRRVAQHRQGGGGNNFPILGGGAGGLVFVIYAGFVISYLALSLIHI